MLYGSVKDNVCVSVLNAGAEGVGFNVRSLNCLMGVVIETWL